MRSILITVLLLIAVLVLYTDVTGGGQGTKAQLARSGEAMGESIRRSSP